ncbi:winged helix-turn-helix domain-containing protein [Dethiosulfovibrio salsuginis]|uniref:Regulatory protein, arsR family n=1 Tax=Dethiosulfovibrio salsuginis TaxID=561720 RepID=A0A1X7JQU6_9BACT|nr:winged helix-turn-helix domain-containing protein [Dethiosulfovibrio salsuginis]SMG30700.1 regulatory protein, arsR family [Dethiosulfovibrio salsuginis]
MEDHGKILEALSSGPMRPGEVADATGLDKDSVSKALKSLKAEGKVISPKRCYYGLP